MSYLADVKKRTVSGAISYFLRTLVLQSIGLISIFILSAYFSPEDFAIYGFVIQIIGILIFFSDIGLAAALVQKKEEPSVEDYRTAFTVQQILSWLIVLVSIVVAQQGFVEQKTGTTGLWILASLAVSFPLATLKTVPSVILERKLLFSKLVVPQIFEQIFFHSILIYMAVKGLGAFSYTYAILARSVVGAVVMWYIQPWPIGFSLSRSALKHLLGYGVKFQVNDFLARIKDQLFFLVLGIWLPLREFGYVQWAKNWSMYPYNLTVSNVMAVTFPTFSRLQHDKTSLSKAIEKSLFFITLFIFPTVAGMAIFITPFVELVPQYQKWIPAAASLICFSLSIGLSSISTPLTNTLNAVGEINTTLKLMIFWTSITWGLTPIFVYFFGFTGVAIAALVIALTSFLPVWAVKKVVSFNFSQQVSRQFLGVLAMLLVGTLGQNIWSNSWQSFIMGILACSIVYLVTFLMIGYTKLRTELESLRRAL